MTERDKIIEIVEHSRTCDVNNSCYACKYDKELENYKDMSCCTLRIADALLANGYDDVAKWKKRAEVAERALMYAVSEYRCDECPCIDCNAEIRGSQECVNLIAKTYKEEAKRDIEREIEEEERK